jgi:hypothetical protein
MNYTEARTLYFDSARFWLERVQQADSQTVEDVLAIMDWKQEHKDIRWAAHHGRAQVYASAIIRANVVLAELNMRRAVIAERSIA